MISLSKQRHIPGPWDAKTPDRHEVILADPAWQYSDKRPGRGGCEAHYNTLTPAELRAIPVQRIAAEDCALFMWVTGPHMTTGLAVLRAWGFEFRTMAFTWVKVGDTGKLAWGTGSWTRANAEFCLLGIKGKPKRASAGVHSVIRAPRGEHSVKPPEVRDRIVRLMGDVPRIELFARERIPGWGAWGDQLPEDPTARRCAMGT